MTDTDFDFDFDVDRDAATSGTRAADDAGAGKAEGKANGSNGSRATGSNGSRGSNGSDKPPLAYGDDHEPGFEAPADDPHPFAAFAGPRA